MAVYRISDMLRMKREALGITREKLCEMSGEICSPQTLYRMECGKVKVKQEVYRKLMECMGELPERSYASIMVSKYQALNLKLEIQAHMFRSEYEEAEEKLKQLEQYMDADYVRNKQYLLEEKSKIAYYKKEISVEEYLERLWEALRYTIPSLEKIEFNKWPYHSEEYDIFIDIANVYHGLQRKDWEEELLLKMKENIEKKYMEERDYVARHTQCLVGLSQLMSMANEHKKSIEYSTLGIEECIGQRALGLVYSLLYDLAWNKEQMIQKGMLDKKERVSCKRLLVQAYYLSVAQNTGYRLERIKKLCECYYPDEIKLF